MNIFEIVIFLSPGAGNSYKYSLCNKNHMPTTRNKKQADKSRLRVTRSQQPVTGNKQPGAGLKGQARNN
jgi:hypothetical protein